jgi:predicted nucleic acid-binding protein
MTSFVDTNILLYYFSTTPEDSKKQSISHRLLLDADMTLSVQVLQEFFVQSTRPTRPNRIPEHKATEFIATLMRFPIQPLTLEVFEHALQLTARYRFSYWDSAIIAAALAAQCDTLFTEDLHHGQIIDGLKIVNPFKED